MSTIAKVANGTLFKVGDGGGSAENFTTIPECRKINGPQIKFDLLDATSHDSEDYFREYVPGLADGDSVTTDLNWRPSNTVHTSLREDQYERTLRNFELVFPDTGENLVDFAGYIQQYAPTAGIGELLMNNLSVKITGKPEWSDPA